MRVTRSTRRAMIFVGVAAASLGIATAGVWLALDRWQSWQHQRLATLMGRLEAELGPLDLARLQAPPIPEAENAGAALLAAARGIPESCRGASADARGLLGEPVGSWGGPKRRKVAEQLASCTESIAALIAAADRPAVGFHLDRGPEEEGWLQSDSEQGALALLTATRILTLDGRLAAESDDPGRLMAAWRALASISSGLARESSVVQGLLATAVLGSELRLVHGLLESGRLPAELIVEARRHFESLADRGDMLPRALAVDIALVRPAYERHLDEEKPWDSWNVAREMECSYGLFLGHFDATWVDLERALDEGLERCADAAVVQMPNTRDALLRFRTGDAARQLMITALALYEQALVERLMPTLDEVDVGAPNRFTRETLHVEMAEGGTLVLSYPEAKKLAQARDRKYPDLTPEPPFEVRLPLPGS